MRSLLVSIFFSVCVLLPGNTMAQYAIPNGSFETWTGVNQPAKWQVVQGKPTQGNVYKYTIIDGHGDTLHLARAAKNGASFIDMPMLDTASPCIIRQKFAMKGRPRYFSMNYAYFPETSKNQFQVSFLFTKWNTTLKAEDTILAGAYNDSAGKLEQPWSTILKADLSGVYNSNLTENPDTGLIIINSSLQGSPNLKTVLLIDEIYFTDTLVSAGINIPETAFLNPQNVDVFPNPFSGLTSIHYHLSQCGQVALNVLDMQGKIVSNLVYGIQGSGNQTAIFDGSKLANGIYFYQLISPEGIQTGKLVLSH